MWDLMAVGRGGADVQCMATAVHEGHVGVEAPHSPWPSASRKLTQETVPPDLREGVEEGVGVHAPDGGGRRTDCTGLWPLLCRPRGGALTDIAGPVVGRRGGGVGFGPSPSRLGPFSGKWSFLGNFIFKKTVPPGAVT